MPSPSRGEQSIPGSVHSASQSPERAGNRDASSRGRRGNEEVLDVLRTTSDAARSASQSPDRTDTLRGRRGNEGVPDALRGLQFRSADIFGQEHVLPSAERSHAEISKNAETLDESESTRQTFFQAFPLLKALGQEERSLVAECIVARQIHILKGNNADFFPLSMDSSLRRAHDEISLSDQADFSQAKVSIDHAILGALLRDADTKKQLKEIFRERTSLQDMDVEKQKLYVLNFKDKVSSLIFKDNFQSITESKSHLQRDLDITKQDLIKEFPGNDHHFDHICNEISLALDKEISPYEDVEQKIQKTVEQFAQNQHEGTMHEAEQKLVKEIFSSNLFNRWLDEGYERKSCIEHMQKDVQRIFQGIYIDKLSRLPIEEVDKFTQAHDQLFYKLGGSMREELKKEVEKELKRGVIINALGERFQHILEEGDESNVVEVFAEESRYEIQKFILEYDPNENIQTVLDNCVGHVSQLIPAKDSDDHNKREKIKQQMHEEVAHEVSRHSSIRDTLTTTFDQLLHPPASETALQRQQRIDNCADVITTRLDIRDRSLAEEMLCDHLSSVRSHYIENIEATGADGNDVGNLNKVRNDLEVAVSCERTYREAEDRFSQLLSRKDIHVRDMKEISIDAAEFAINTIVHLDEADTQTVLRARLARAWEGQQRNPTGPVVLARAWHEHLRREIDTAIERLISMDTEMKIEGTLQSLAHVPTTRISHEVEQTVSQVLHSLRKHPLEEALSMIRTHLDSAYYALPVKDLRKNNIPRVYEVFHEVCDRHQSSIYERVEDTEVLQDRLKVKVAESVTLMYKARLAYAERERNIEVDSTLSTEQKQVMKRDNRYEYEENIYGQVAPIVHNLMQRAIPFERAIGTVYNIYDKHIREQKMSYSQMQELQAIRKVIEQIKFEREPAWIERLPQTKDMQKDVQQFLQLALQRFARSNGDQELQEQLQLKMTMRLVLLMMGSEVQPEDHKLLCHNLVRGAFQAIFNNSDPKEQVRIKELKNVFNEKYFKPEMETYREIKINHNITHELGTQMDFANIQSRTRLALIKLGQHWKEIETNNPKESGPVSDVEFKRNIDHTVKTLIQDILAQTKLHAHVKNQIDTIYVNILYAIKDHKFSLQEETHAELLSRVKLHAEYYLTHFSRQARSTVRSIHEIGKQTNTLLEGLPLESDEREKIKEFLNVMSEDTQDLALRRSLMVGSESAESSLRRALSDPQEEDRAIRLAQLDAESDENYQQQVQRMNAIGQQLSAFRDIQAAFEHNQELMPAFAQRMDISPGLQRLAKRIFSRSIKQAQNHLVEEIVHTYPAGLQTGPVLENAYPSYRNFGEPPIESRPYTQEQLAAKEDTYLRLSRRSQPDQIRVSKEEFHAAMKWAREQDIQPDNVEAFLAIYDTLPDQHNTIEQLHLVRQCFAVQELAIEVIRERDQLLHDPAHAGPVEPGNAADLYHRFQRLYNNHLKQYEGLLEQYEVDV